MQLSCGNKVSPASLVTSACDSNSTETGYASGMESQHSQASLFSGSEATSSLELFSQPLSNQSECNHPHSHHTSAKSERELSHSDSLSQPTSEITIARGKKFYMKYLSLHSNTSKPVATKQNAELVKPVSNGMDFEVWKEKQHSKSERKELANEIAAIVNETSRKVNDGIAQAREELKASIETLHASKEEQICLQQWGKQFAGLFTQLLQGQEETKLAVQEMKTELTKQQNIMKSLSSQLSAMATADTHTTLSFVTDKIISGVSATLKSALPACRVSVSTQTDDNIVEERCDQTVPEDHDTTREILFSESDENKDVKQHDRNIQTQPQHCSTFDAHCSNEMVHLPLSQKQTQMFNTLLQQDSPNPMKEGPHSPLQIAKKTIREPSRTHGKRKNEVSVAPSKKKLCRTSSPSKIIGEKTKLNGPSTFTRRQSKRTLKMPLQYKGDSGDDVLKGTKPHQNNKGRSSSIRRKTSRMSSTGRNCSFESTSAHSSSGLSDMFCSGTSPLECQSHPENPPPETKTIVKFERSNEDAKRRKMVISNLTDPDLLLREIQNCILNRVDSDPSP